MITILENASSLQGYNHSDVTKKKPKKGYKIKPIILYEENIMMVKLNV